MPQRRANDAQVNRLLQALRTDLTYRQDLAKKISDREGIKYDSAMRRLQRYITTGSERRSFVRAPVEKQRIVRQIVRQEPLPAPPLRKLVPLEPEAVYKPGPAREREPEAYGARALRGFEDETTSLYELRAIIAYFDGDTREAGRALGVDSRLLDLASQGTVITRRMGQGRIDEGVRKLYEKLTADDIEDIQDFSDLLHNLPDWRIGLLLDDLGNGDSTFSEWIDAWRDDSMNIDADDSEFWALWRAAYQRAVG